MKKLLVAAFVALPLVGCTEEVIVKKVPAPAEAPNDEQPTEATDSTEPAPSDDPATQQDPAKKDPAKATGTADDCLDGQDMDAADVDISKCPALPAAPASAPMGAETISLGAWELGTTADGDTYKYGSLSKPGTSPRVLSFDGGQVAVNDENVDCWAKGYYRLRKILQDPPKEYLALYKAGFQYRFFQFQTDLRNGATGYKSIASFQDHLVKWVTVISKTGQCQQPTYTKFKTYAAAELETRGLPAVQ